MYAGGRGIWLKIVSGVELLGSATKECVCEVASSNQVSENNLQAL